MIKHQNNGSILRSTPPSRPNNIRGGNVRPSVGMSITSIHPSTKSLSDFNEIWYVHRGRWMMWLYAIWPDSRSRSRGPLKLRKLHFSKSISSGTYRGSWQMTT